MKNHQQYIDSKNQNNQWIEEQHEQLLSRITHYLGEDKEEAIKQALKEAFNKGLQTAVECVPEEEMVRKLTRGENDYYRVIGHNTCRDTFIKRINEQKI